MNWSYCVDGSSGKDIHCRRAKITLIANSSGYLYFLQFFLKYTPAVSSTIFRVDIHSNIYRCFFFSLFFFILRRMGKNKALAHHTSTNFYTRRVSILQMYYPPNVYNSHVLCQGEHQQQQNMKPSRCQAAAAAAVAVTLELVRARGFATPGLFGPGCFRRGFGGSGPHRGGRLVSRRAATRLKFRGGNGGGDKAVISFFT